MAEPWLAETASCGSSDGGDNDDDIAGPASASCEGCTSGRGFCTTSPKGAKASGVSGWAVTASAACPYSGSGRGVGGDIDGC